MLLVLLSFRKANKVARDSYIMVTPPPEVKEDQALKEPQGYLVPCEKIFFQVFPLLGTRFLVKCCFP